MGLVLAAVLIGTVASAAPPPELRKVHALLVVDTLGELGESVKVDGERIDRLLSNNLPRDRVEIRLITGKDANADAILAYYRDLKVGRDDALFFYYAGHGATDPKKGHFMALQKLNARPLIRADLLQAMEAHQPGLVVLMTDCCSNRYTLPGKTRAVFLDKGASTTIDPALRCLLYQSRGVVDITASTGNTSYGDDHEGGIFTRTFDKVVTAGVAASDENGDGFLSWPEFFARLQTETEGVFVDWAKKQRALGEDVDQTSQKPHAFALGGADAVRIRNDAPKALTYRYRWSGEAEWRETSLEPHGIDQHAPPAGRGGAEPLTLVVRFEGGKSAVLKLGRTYRFHDTPGH